jgi:septal ring factor EnvC (AmiA/AmiB activator)
MSHRRAALALSVLTLLASPVLLGGAPARADTVEQAEQRLERREGEVDAAYAVVDEAVQDRDQVEAELFAALVRHGEAAEALADATRRLQRTGRALAVAEAGATQVDGQMQTQAVAAYIEAVAAPGSVVAATRTVEQAMVVGQAFDDGQSESLELLDAFSIQLRELTSLREEYQREQTEVAALEQRLAAESTELEALFARADQAVAEAFRAAQAADAAYREALTDVERARAEAAAQEAPDPAPPPTTADPEPDPTTTTTAATTTTTSGEPAPIKPGVEQWRPLVAAHFPADRVDDALRIMGCESNGDPDAVNPYTGASGLYQFIPSTWAVASVSAGVGDRSVFDGEANIIAAAWLSGYYEANGQSPWEPWHCREYL